MWETEFTAFLGLTIQPASLLDEIQASKEKKRNKTKGGTIRLSYGLHMCSPLYTYIHMPVYAWTGTCIHTRGLVFGLCWHYMMAGECLSFLSLCTSCAEADIPWYSIDQVQDEYFRCASSRSTVHGIMTQNYVVSDCKLPSKLRDECVKISHLKLTLVIFLFLCVHEFLCHVTHMEAREQLAEVGSLRLPSGFWGVNSGH